MTFCIDTYKKRNRDIARKGAVSYWTDKKNGINRWGDKDSYTVEYCKKQIEYFKNLKF